MHDRTITLAPLDFPQPLLDMAAMVEKAAAEEAQALIRAGYDPGEAVRLARERTRQQREAVSKAAADWAATQPLRAIVDAKP